jgi:DNA uptake protein ComE-like DNA-binding protein
MRKPLRSVIFCAALGSIASGATAFADRAQAPQPGAAAAVAKPAPAAKPGPPVKLVDINSASRTELTTLPGIGNAEAERIIKARPYPSKAKLLADKVLTPAQYSALQGRIVAIQKQPPKSSSRGAGSASPPAGKS